MLLQCYNGPGYHKSYSQAFNCFSKNVGFNNDVSAAQPDMFEGLDLTQFDPFPAHEQLGGAATVYSGPEATTLPHLAGEWKGPGKDLIRAQTEAAYDGACMVYGRNEARSFLNTPDPTGHAYVHTFTTDGTTLNTFAHYSSESEDQVKYHQYPTSSSFLIASYEDFKKSRRRSRNLQDDAKEASEKLRDVLNEKWLANHRPPVAPSVPAGAADSDCKDGEDLTNKSLAEYWTSFPTINQYDSSAQIPAADNVYAPPPATENNQDESFVQIPAAESVHAPPYASFPAHNEDDPFMQISTVNNGHTSPDGLTFSLITPPQSLKDTLLPLEWSEDIDGYNVRSPRRTRQTYKRAVDTVERPREVDHKSDTRKTRRKHQG